MEREHAELITASEAAEILSKNAGREIKSDYVRVLASARYGNKLTRIRLDQSRNLYLRSEIEKIRVGTRPGRRAKER